MVRDGPHSYPSIRGVGRFDLISETRVGWLQQLFSATAAPVLVDVDGRVCGLEVEVGDGRAVQLAAELPSHPRLFTALAGDLGVDPGLLLVSDIPGVVATTSRSPAGDRMLHLLNPTGYQAAVAVGLAGAERAELTVPAHTGHLLARGLTTPWGRLDSATSEITAVGANGLTVGPSLAADGHRLVLRTDRRVTADSGTVTAQGIGVVVSSAASGLPRTIALG